MSKQPTELLHRTCLAIAMKVYETQTWKFSDAGGDLGMNLSGPEGYTHNNHYAHSGALIVFHWLGNPALKTDLSAENLDGKDILYDQRPWRMFVGPGLSPNLMQIARIELTGDKDGYCHKCGAYGHVGWLDKLISSRRPAELKKLVDRTNKELAKNKRFIKKMEILIDFIPPRQ